LLIDEKLARLTQLNDRYEYVELIEKLARTIKITRLQGWGEIDLTSISSSSNQVSVEELIRILYELIRLSIISSGKYSVEEFETISMISKRAAQIKKEAKEKAILLITDLLQATGFNRLDNWPRLNLQNLQELRRLSVDQLQVLLSDLIRKIKYKGEQKIVNEQLVQRTIESQKTQEAIPEYENDITDDTDLEMIEEPDDLDEIYDGDPVLIDSLAVIEKYKNGNPNISKNVKATYKEDPSWKKEIPKELRDKGSINNETSIDEVFAKAKEVLAATIGRQSNELRIFISNLSTIIYDREEYYREQNEDESSDRHSLDEDKISELVMFKVETIILPHIEVLEAFKKSGGNIIYSNEWNKTFTEALKNEVKERDEHKCVICESGVDLHVHHKIPRALGGVHHVDNLVTLCSSCHPAIETADIQKAFPTCLFNYKKAKAMKTINIDLPTNKTFLKNQVKQRLDYVLNELIRRNNHELAKEIVEVKNRLELIFDPTVQSKPATNKKDLRLRNSIYLVTPEKVV